MYPEFKTWTISFKDRETFNDVSSWEGLEALDVIDIGYSDMIFIFDNREDFQSFEYIIMNHIKPNKYILGDN